MTISDFKTQSQDELLDLIAAGDVDCNERGPAGETPLHEVAARGFLKVVRRLLKLGAEVNARSNYKATPLWWAAKRGHAKVAKALIDAGADPCLADFDGVTPLHCAAAWKHFGVAELLIFAGADADAEDDLGRTPASIDESGHITEIMRRKRSKDTRADINSLFDDLFDTPPTQPTKPPAPRRGRRGDIIL